MATPALTQGPMKSALPRILTINGGSSSIRFAVYETGETPQRLLDGKSIESV